MKNFLFSILVISCCKIAYTQTSVLPDAFRNFSKYAPAGALNGDYITAFNTIENTKGRRYLFDKWVHGSVIISNGSIVKGDSILFNYDKATNALIFTLDGKNILLVTPGEARSFTLIESGVQYNFIKPDSILSYNGFLQVLTSNKAKYTLYKQYQTKF